MVLGSPGSGKSTLARALGQALQLPVCHLDRLYTRDGHKLPVPAWAELTENWARRDAWVIDGNYLATLELRYARADTLVLLDLPRPLCLWRALRRSLNPGVPIDERVSLNGKFVRYIWNYRRSQKQHLAALSNFPHIRLVILRAPREVSAFIHDVQT